MKKGTSSRKILLCTLLISLAAILLSYLGFVIYFSNHFYYTTKNGKSQSFCHFLCRSFCLKFEAFHVFTKYFLYFMSIYLLNQIHLF